MPYMYSKKAFLNEAELINHFNKGVLTMIITMTNQKGGVGKTTTTATVGMLLKDRGYNVLAIDMDPQGNLSFCLGADVETSATIYEVLKGDVRLQHAIQHTETIDVVTSSIALSGLELEFVSSGREYLLKEAIRSLPIKYDFILIDTPPALSLLTVNAFTASTNIIVPMLADIFSLQGIAQIYESCERVKKYTNPSLKILGILLIKYNPRSIFAREIWGTAEMISKDLEIKLFDTYIRESVTMREAQAMQKNIVKYAPRSNVAKDYTSFMDELLLELSNQ